MVAAGQAGQAKHLGTWAGIHFNDLGRAIPPLHSGQKQSSPSDIIKNSRNSRKLMVRHIVAEQGSLIYSSNAGWGRGCREELYCGDERSSGKSATTDEEDTMLCTFLYKRDVAPCKDCQHESLCCQYGRVGEQRPYQCTLAAPPPHTRTLRLGMGRGRGRGRATLCRPTLQELRARCHPNGGQPEAYCGDN
ncbi:hypothetical protein J6590_043798 [Homalodisca vitripennis]|nr:hypothetical protein J6590_043798 [Homalodisca vitripennis]